MAIGDGTTWDETTPTDATVAVNIDDYNRDVRVGMRSRFAHEHEMPASQSATSEGGKHKFMTLQEQGVKPTLSGTQIAAIYADTNNNLVFEKSDGTVVTVVAGTAVGDGKVLANATDAAASYLQSKIGYGLTSSGTNVVSSTLFVRNLAEGSDIIQAGSGQCGASANTTITLGTNFANANYSVGVTLIDPNDTGSGSVQQQLAVGTVGASSFVVINNNGSVRNFHYMCIGSQG